MKVVTNEYNLLPPSHYLPIMKHQEFNVTLNDRLCGSETNNMYEMNVTVSLLLSDNVIQNLPFVACILSNRNNVHKSEKVYLSNFISSTSTTTEEPHSTEGYQTNSTHSIVSTTRQNTMPNFSNGTLCCAAVKPHPNKVLSLCILLCLISYLM